MAIRKCRGITPPVNLDTYAKTTVHAFRRLRSHRYVWIRDWLLGALQNPLPGDTGGRVVQRCFWSLHKAIRAEYAGRRKEERIPKRIRRDTYPDRAEVLNTLSTLPPIAEPVLRDLWERLLEAYPDWKLMTNVYLAGVLCVHHNTIASRRHALAVIQHAAAHGCTEQLFALQKCLRLVIGIGAVRKVDIHRAESHLGVLNRIGLVTKPQLTGYKTVVDWNHGSEKGAASGTFYQVPVFEPLEKVNVVRDNPERCSYIEEDGRQCLFVASRCPDHRGKADIVV